MLQLIIFILSVCLWLTPSYTQQQHQQIDTSEFTCLLAVLFHESRGETLEGIRAVASVVLNRKDHPSLYPRTVCGVVLQHKQFSNVEYTYQKALEQPTMLQKDLGYTKVLAVAYEALYGRFKPSVSALDYHAVGIRPYWSKYLKNSRVIGNHRFGVVQYKPSKRN